MVMSFHKSEASDATLAVMTSRFTPAASAASRMRVVPETAVSRMTWGLAEWAIGDATWMMASTPFTACERSEVARSSMTVVVNLSPYDS